MPMRKPVLVAAVMEQSAPSDTTAPTVTITCAQTGPTATSPLNLTFTLSEIATDFAIGDITVGNGTAGNFAGSGVSYTCDVTPTASGAVTVDVAANAFHDAAGNGNTAATQFSITVIVYTLQDLFTTDDAAPITTPRTCEPGPGTLVATDTGNRQGIVSGQLKRVLTVGRNWGDPGIWGNSTIARAAGMALMTHFNVSILNQTGGMIGWDANQAAMIDESGVHLYDGGTLYGRVGSASVPAVKTYAATTDYTVEIILRATGFFVVFNDELVFVDASRTTANMYPAVVTGDSGTATWLYNHLRVAQLPAPWNTDNGIATQVLAGARAQGDAFTHEADCIIEFVCTTRPSAGNYHVIQFRKQDATNYWQVTVASNGDMTIDEVVDGTPTNRASSAGAVGPGARVMITCRGTTIRAQHATVAAQGCVYTSATNFQTATAGSLLTLGTGGAVATIITWPVTLSGSAKAVLDAANP